MTIEEIRKNAPEDATHYSNENGIVKYYKHLLFGFYPDCILEFKDGVLECCYANVSELKPI